MDRYISRSVLGGVFVGILATEVLYYVVKRLRLALTNDSDETPTQRKNTIHEVLFFPDNKPSCKAQYLTPVGCMDRRCRYAHEGTVIISWFNFPN